MGICQHDPYTSPKGFSVLFPKSHLLFSLHVSNVLERARVCAPPRDNDEFEIFNWRNDSLTQPGDFDSGCVEGLYQY
jgi:hypothetical protein